MVRSLELSGADFSRTVIPVDVFVPVLHGTFGEDGCIQGLLELGGCAYVGCGVLASAVGMNKRLTKVVAAQAGVPVVPWLSCERSVLDRDRTWMRKLPARVARHFGWPVIVKPCNLGSSAGVSVAATPDELIAGVLRVFEYDVEALIEPFIKNRLELNVAVAGLDEPVASVTEMPVTHQESPLTFSEKYKRQGRKSVGSSEGMAGALRVLDPQDLPEELRARAQQLATTVFAALGLRRDRANRLSDRCRQGRAVLQRDQHAARFARLLPVVGGAALLDDHRAPVETDSAGRTHQGDEAWSGASPAPGIATLELNARASGPIIRREEISSAASAGARCRTSRYRRRP